VSNIEERKGVGQAHGEYFEEIRPATNRLEVLRLISREVLVEIEADAVAVERAREDLPSSSG